MAPGAVRDPSTNGREALPVQLIVASLRRAAHAPTLCAAEAASRALRRRLRAADADLWRPLVVPRLPLLPGGGTAITSLLRDKGNSQPRSGVWKDLYRILSLYGRIRDDVAFVWETVNATEIAPEIGVGVNAQVAAHLSSIITDSAVVGRHMIHHSNQVVRVDMPSVAGLLPSPRNSHPVPHTQPDPPRRILYSDGDSSRRILQYDLDARAEIPASEIPGLVSVAEVAACGRRLAVLKMISLNFGELHVWDLGNGGGGDGVSGDGEEGGAGQPTLVAAARMKKPILYLPAFGCRGDLVVVVRKDEDRVNRARAVETVASSIASSTTAQADSAALDPMSILSLMRSLEGQSASVRSSVTERLQAALGGGGGGGASPAAPAPAAPTASSPATPPPNNPVLVEVRSTLAADLPVVCAVPLDLPSASSRVLACVTPHHLVTLVRGESVLELWSLRTGARVGRLDVARALAPPEAAPAGAKRETLTRMVAADDSCGATGLLLGTSLGAAIWVDLAARRFVQSTRGERGDRGGLWMVVASPREAAAATKEERGEETGGSLEWTPHSCELVFKRFPLKKRK